MALDRERIAHYKLIGVVGAGAMGEVYLAEDEHLRRRVAVKVIATAGAADPTARRRFLREAEAASALTHPNIAHVYDIGTDDGIDYIAMEYIEGETLAARLARGAMPIEAIVDLALQLADALAAAHDRGIVHRDVKPSNLMIDSRGGLKMLDFGLARMETAPVDSDGETLSHPTVTTPGLIVGTTSYMSPEQALGEPAVPASDVFSAGVVLYELITGRRPFAGRTAADTLHRLTHLEPEALARFNYDLPVELERIVRKCLEKSASRRYHSARELLVDLQALARDRSSGAKAAPRWAAATPRFPPRQTMAVLLVIGVIAIATGAALLRRRPPAATRHGAVRSIAVLPFRFAGPSDAGYVSDGMTESLINALGEDARIRVMARSTVFRFRQSALTPQQVGRELGVDAVVSADLQQRGNALIIAAELVSVDDGARLWGQRYERKPSELMGIEADLAKGVVRALRLDYVPREPAASGAKRDDAHALYLRAQYAMNERTAPSIRAAAEDYGRAIAADPSYAPPYAGLADTYTLSARYADVQTAELAARAREAAGKALQLDPSLPEAHVSLASVYDTCDWNWAAAGQEYLEAIALRPGDVLAHQWYALLLTRLGRTDEARAEMQIALRLDPLSPRLNLSAANADYYAGRYDDAANLCAKARALDPAFPFTHLQMALILIQQRRYDEARAALEASGSSAAALAARGVLDAREGKTAAAAATLEQLAARGADYERAVVAAALRRDEQALESLERACARRNVYAGYARVDPLLAALHGNRRFAALLEKAGLQ
ncbi:MAG: serine/threonine protein kinase with repeat [Acidobacteria bacterium]|nr:serine/threonine protein kinase with repeat [Acidobacteriota bacterium]